MELIPPAEPLSDGVIALRLREPKDRAAVAAASHDEETRRWLDDQPIPPADAATLPDPRATWAGGERAPFVIVDHATDTALGLLSLRVIADRVGSIGISVFPEGRGRGVAPAALRLAARWALTSAGFTRVEAESHVDNASSRRAIEKAGFRYEGILRDHCETGGRRHDCAMFALDAADLARSTHVTRHINAARSKVYAALIDADAVAQWKFPTGMTCEVHRFEPREGGTIRVSLTYDKPNGRGKTSAHTDTYSGRFVALDPDRRVVEVDEFESDDPDLRGAMTSTITLADSRGGTEVTGLHEGLPPGVSLADNEVGWRSALARLAALVEAE